MQARGIRWFDVSTTRVAETRAFAIDVLGLHVDEQTARTSSSSPRSTTYRANPDAGRAPGCARARLHGCGRWVVSSQAPELPVDRPQLDVERRDHLERNVDLLP